MPQLRVGLYYAGILFRSSRDNPGIFGSDRREPGCTGRRLVALRLTASFDSRLRHVLVAQENSILDAAELAPASYNALMRGSGGAGAGREVRAHVRTCQIVIY